MPYLNLLVGKNLDNVKKTEILSSLSQIVADVLGKPQDYIMVSLTEGEINMAGTNQPAAFVDLRSIGGINPKTNKVLSQKICSLLCQKLTIAENRIYCNFSDITAQNWGWNGSTF